MHKSMLIGLVSNRTGVSRSHCEAVIDAAFDITAATMARGERVIFSGFGVFEPKSRAPRIGRNPHTGEPVDIPGCVTPNFKPARSLKDRVSGGVSTATKSHRTSPAK